MFEHQKMDYQFSQQTTLSDFLNFFSLQEGYISQPTKQEKNTIGIVARNTLSMPFISKFNTNFFTKKRKTSKLAELYQSEIGVYNVDSIFNANVNGTTDDQIPTNGNEILTRKRKSNCLGLNHYENIPHENGRKMLGDKESINNKEETESYIEQSPGEQRITNLEKEVQKINRHLDERFNVILKTLIEIKEKPVCGKNCEVYLDNTTSTVSSPDYEKRHLSWEEFPTKIETGESPEGSLDGIDESNSLLSNQNNRL